MPLRATRAMTETPGIIEALAERAVVVVMFTYIFSFGLIAGQVTLFEPLGIELVAPFPHTVTGEYLDISHIRESLSEARILENVEAGQEITARIAACEGRDCLGIMMTDFVQLVQVVFRMVTGTYFLYILEWLGVPGPWLDVFSVGYAFLAIHAVMYYGRYIMDLGARASRIVRG